MERKPNFESLRVIAMLMIVLSHCVYFGVVRSGLPDAYELWNSGALPYKVLSAFSILGSIGVGLFFMLSGYFTAHSKKTSIRKVCAVTLYYAGLTVLIGLGALLCDSLPYESNGTLILDIAQSLLTPLTGSSWWYVTAHIVLMLIAPAYNGFLGRLNPKGFRIWLLLLLVFGYTLGNLGSNFYDLMEALLFYTLGAWFRDCESPKRAERRSVYLSIALTGILLNGICQYGILTYAIRFNIADLLLRKTFSIAEHMLSIPLACYGLFGFFRSLDIRSRAVNRIARHTFGIYLLHDAPLLRPWLWFVVLKPYAWFGSPSFLICLPLCVAAIFCAGIAADLLREKLFDSPINRAIDRVTAWFGRVGYR